MEISLGSYEWALEEFGGARLGNALRTERAVEMANACLLHPAGKVTEVFNKGAAREGAFRFVENDAISVKALMAAPHQAAVRRCQEAPFAFVPIDKSSLTLTDG